MVATASLELGLDIGSIDLVAQLGSPRSIAVMLQRLGRSGHRKSAISKGVLFAMTRDELVEATALIRAVHEGNLDAVRMPDKPLDVLAQQVVAEVAAREWDEDELFELVRGASPYQGLTRDEYEKVLHMVSEGVATRRGRSRVHLHRDRVNGWLRPRKGARLLRAAERRRHSRHLPVPGHRRARGQGGRQRRRGLRGGVDAGRRVRARLDLVAHSPHLRRRGAGGRRARPAALGAVLERRGPGAHRRAVGRGGAPARGRRAARRRAGVADEGAEAARARPPSSSCGTCARAPRRSARCPASSTVVAERFFDEAGGMQLIVHAPFGARINRAWGMALRKSFCRPFDFELQAAATDDGDPPLARRAAQLPADGHLRLRAPEQRRAGADPGGAPGADLRHALSLDRRAGAGALANEQRQAACLRRFSARARRT